MPKVNPDATEAGSPAVTTEVVPPMTAKAIAAAADKKAQEATAAQAAEVQAENDAALEVLKAPEAKLLMSNLYMVNPYTAQVWFPGEQHEEHKVDVDNWTKAQILAGLIAWV